MSQSAVDKVAFVVAGTHSGCGKTTVALALMAAFRALGRRVQPFKVGPDFIDPGFHTRLTGRASRNLDGWMLSRVYNEALFRRLLGDADVAIIEGVMGLFDGYDGLGEAGSSAEMAKWLGIPVILVVDAGSMARSAAALVYGFSRFDPDLKVAGVIFNRVGSRGHCHYLQTAMAANLPDIAVLGGIPRDREIALPERHLGLVMADELALDRGWLKRVRELAEQHLDLERLSSVARLKESNVTGEVGAVHGVDLSVRHGEGESRGHGDGSVVQSPRPRVPASPRLKSTPGRAAQTPGPEGPAPVIAVARDAAFCFYYADNLEALQDAGAVIEFFSPLAGEPLPANAAGLYLGGGYPELHAARLTAQRPWFTELRRAAQNGMPIYAECGGMMVLGRFIETSDGERYPMAAILPFGTRMLKRRKALGYTEVVLRQPCLLGSPGTRIRGHEFHYSEVIEKVDEVSVRRVYELQGRHGGGQVMEGYQVESVLASYVHLHFGSAEGVAAALVTACRQYRTRLQREGR